MDFAVLGPLRVTGSAGPVEIPGAKERTLLAHLISAAPRTVSTAALIRSLWDDTPPRSAVKSLQTHILRTRDALEPGRRGVGSLLLTDGAGYRLALTDEQVDADRFAAAAASGHLSLHSGDPVAASRTLTAAERLWRGPAYAGFENTAFGPAATQRLSEMRLAAVEDRLTADLQLGAAGRIVAEIESQIDAEPYRERLWALLVAALYAGGRQADALAAYQRVRIRLDEDLGIGPGPELREIHRRVLAQDPVLTGPQPTPITLPPPPPPAETDGPPPQAPMLDTRCPWQDLDPYGIDDVPWFHGRERLVAELSRMLATGRIVALVGGAGTGKTSVLLAGLVAALPNSGHPGHCGHPGSVVVLHPGDHPMGAAAQQLRTIRPGAVVIIDRFEEVFTGSASATERADFLDLIADLVIHGSAATVVLALRADHLRSVAGHPRLAGLLADRSVTVTPPTAAEIRRIVELPAARAGLVFDAGLVDAIVTDLGGDPGENCSPLPALSAVLSRLWRHRNGSRLTFAAYLGGGAAAAGFAGRRENAGPASSRPLRLPTGRPSRPARGVRLLLAAVLVVVFGATVTDALRAASRQEALSVQRSVQAARTAAEARRLTVVADHEPRLDLALLTAAQAVSLDVNPQTYGALLAVLARAPDVRTQVSGGSTLLQIETVPDGPTVWLSDDRSSATGSARAVDAETGALTAATATLGPASEMELDAAGAVLLISDDGRGGHVLVVNADGGLRWERSAVELARTLGAPGSVPTGPAGWLATGEVLFTQGSMFVIADGADGEVRRTLAYPVVGTASSAVQLADGGLGVSVGGRPFRIDPAGTSVVPMPVPGLVSAASSTGALAVTSAGPPGTTIVRLVPAAVTTAPAIVVNDFGGALAFSPDGSLLAIGTGSTVEIRDGSTLRLHRRLTGHSAAVTDLAFVDAGNLWSAGADGAALSWDVTGATGTGPESYGDSRAQTGENAAANDIAVALRRAEGSAATEDGVYLVDPHTGSVLGEELPMPGCGRCRPTAVAITPDGATAVAGIDGGGTRPTETSTVVVWDTATRAVRLVVSLTGPVNGIDTSTDGRYAAVNGAAGSAVIDLGTGEVFGSISHPIPRDPGAGGLSAVSPDGRLAAVGIADGIRLLDMATGRTLRDRELAAPGDPVDGASTMAWSANSGAVLVGSLNGYLYRLDAELRPVGRTRISTGPLIDVIVSPDGRWAATLGELGALTIWDAHSWQPLGGPSGDAGGGWLGFDPDGDTVRAVRADGTTLTMSVDPATLVRRACAIAHRDLTAQEWSELRPGIAYDHTCS